MSEKEIFQQISEIRNDFSDIRESVAKIAAQCPGCRDSLGSLKQAMYGNGQDGIKPQVAVLGERTEQMLKAQQSQNKRMFGLIAAIIIAVLGSVGINIKGLASNSIQQPPAAESVEEPN